MSDEKTCSPDSCKVPKFDEDYKRVMVGIVPPQDAGVEDVYPDIDSLGYFDRDEDYGFIWMGEKAGYYLIRGSLKSDKKKDLLDQNYVTQIWDDTPMQPFE